MKSAETRNDAASYQIVLAPGDAIDVTIMEAMASRAASDPASLSLKYKDGIATISVSKK